MPSAADANLPGDATGVQSDGSKSKRRNVRILSTGYTFSENPIVAVSNDGLIQLSRMNFQCTFLIVALWILGAICPAADWIVPIDENAPLGHETWTGWLTDGDGAEEYHGRYLRMAKLGFLPAWIEGRVIGGHSEYRAIYLPLLEKPCAWRSFHGLDVEGYWKRCWKSRALVTTCYASTLSSMRMTKSAFR